MDKIDFGFPFEEVKPFFGDLDLGRVFMMAQYDFKENKFKDSTTMDNMLLGNDTLWKNYMSYLGIIHSIYNKYVDDPTLFDNTTFFFKISLLKSNNDPKVKKFYNNMFDPDNKIKENILSDPYIHNAIDVTPDVKQNVIDGTNNLKNEKWKIVPQQMSDLIKEYLKWKKSKPESSQMPESPFITWSRDNDGKYNQTVGEGEESCYGTAIEPSICQQYMLDCLISPKGFDDASCLNLLANSKFFLYAKEQIKNLHPEKALLTLKKLGFTQEQDRNGKFIIKSYDEWIKNADSKIKQLCENEHFVSYIKLLIGFVNANPTFLNYIKPTQIDVAPFQSFQIKRRIDPKAPSASTEQIKIFQRIPQPPQINLLATTLGFPTMMPFPQSGGYDKYSQKNMFSNLFETTIKELKAKGKTLDEKDYGDIKTKINQLGQIEEGLYKSSEILKKYNELIYQFGDRNVENVNKRQIDKIVNMNNHLLKKLSTNTNKLITIIDILKNASNGQITPDLYEKSYEKPINL